VGDIEANAARTALYLRPTPQTDLQRELSLKQAALDNLRRTGNAEGRKTLLVMDESSLTGALDATKVADLAKSIGARVVFQGDVQQHGSVPAGRVFWQAQQAGMNTAVLQETRRFDNASEQVKTALAAFKDKKFAQALEALDKHEVADGKLADKTAELYVQSLKGLEASGTSNPRVGIVAVTNADRKAINSAVHRSLVNEGQIARQDFIKLHLEDPKLTAAQRTNAGMMASVGVDRLVYRKTYREAGIERGQVLRVRSFDINNNRVNVITPDGRSLTINPQQQDLFEAYKAESRQFAVGDQVTARAVLRLGDEAKTEISNGAHGRITAIDEKGATVAWSDGKSTELGNEALARVDYAYARTSFKEQGATNHIELVAVSERGAKIFNVESHYVAITRAKINTVLITSDLPTMRRNAGAQVEHTMAITEKQLGAMSRAMQVELAKTQRQIPAASVNGVPTPHQAQHQRAQHLGAQAQYSWANMFRAPASTGQVVTQHLAYGKTAQIADSNHAVRVVGMDPSVSLAALPTKEQQDRLDALVRGLQEHKPELRKDEHHERQQSQATTPEQGVGLSASEREAKKDKSLASLNPGDLLAQPDHGKEKAPEQRPELGRHNMPPQAPQKDKEQGWEIGF
jgi:hypothetical protein